jgi:transcriptional regulator with XRE-family HTH domain
VSTIFNKILPAGSVNCDKCFTVNRKQSKLAEVAKSIRDASGWTLKDVEANSGGTITDGYISKIENGYDLNVTLEKLFAFASGLKVSPQVLFDAARGELPSDGVHVARAAELLRELAEADQRVVVKVIEALRERKGGGSKIFMSPEEYKALKDELDDCRKRGRSKRKSGTNDKK